MLFLMTDEIKLTDSDWILKIAVLSVGGLLRKSSLSVGETVPDKLSVTFGLFMGGKSTFDLCREIFANCHLLQYIVLEKS
jgi:hypothetical protein